MSNSEPVDGRCNATTRDGGYCALVEGYGTDSDSGRCKYHGGASTGPPKGNNNAVKHGIYQQRSSYYEDLGAEEKAWVDSLVESMLEDAPFTKDNFHKFQMLREVAIDIHKARRSNDYIGEEGVIVENIERDEDGDPIYEDGELKTKAEENPVNLAYDRLKRTYVKQLKELGIMGDSPDAQQADAEESIASQLAAMREDMED